MGLTHLFEITTLQLGIWNSIGIGIGNKACQYRQSESINLIVVGLNVVVGLFRSKVYKDFCTNILNYYQHETNN